MNVAIEDTSPIGIGPNMSFSKIQPFSVVLKTLMEATERRFHMENIMLQQQAGHLQSQSPTHLPEQEEAA
jgi:hypothetical protein